MAALEASVKAAKDSPRPPPDGPRAEAAARRRRRRRRPSRPRATRPSPRQPSAGPPPQVGLSAGVDTTVSVGGRTLTLSNLDKVLYPEAGFTKAEVIDYYARIAPAMLPHLAGPGPHVPALPERRRRRAASSRSAARRTARRGCRWRLGPGDRQRRHRVLRDRRAGRAGVGGQPGRPRAARADGPGRRPRRARAWWCSTSTRAHRPTCEDCAAIALAIRDVLDAVGLDGVGQDVGLEGPAALRAGQRAAAPTSTPSRSPSPSASCSSRQRPEGGRHRR